MQRIDIDSIVEELKNISMKSCPKILQKNKDEIIFGKQYFLEVGKSQNTIKNEIKKFWGSNSQFMKQLKKQFLRQLVSHGVHHCCYCGKTPNIHWEDKDALKRSYDIEHFLPKSNPQYQSLAINLHNRLLVCTFCNQRLKRDTDTLVSRKEVFHPYFGWIRKQDNEIIIEDETFDKKVSFAPSNLENHILNHRHSHVFDLSKIYLHSQDTYNIFKFIHHKYGVIKDEFQRFKQSNKSIDDFISYFFKNYYPEKEQDILKYSNGKFKKDMVNYVKVILKKTII